MHHMWPRREDVRGKRGNWSPLHCCFKSHNLGRWQRSEFSDLFWWSRIQRRTLSTSDQNEEFKWRLQMGQTKGIVGCISKQERTHEQKASSTDITQKRNSESVFWKIVWLWLSSYTRSKVQEGVLQIQQFLANLHSSILDNPNSAQTKNHKKIILKF